MKVLFLTYDGLTDPLGQSQILPYLCGLSRKGHQIIILSLEKAQALKEEAHSVRKSCDKSGLQWHYLPYPRLRNKPEHLRVLMHLRRKALSLALNNHVDFLHCRSYPSALAGRYVQKKAGIPWIFDIRGFWIDERLEGNVWKGNSFINKAVIHWLRNQEKELYYHASAIVALTFKAKEIIIKKFLCEKTAKPVSVIPCCADYSLFKPADPTNKRQLRASFNLPPSAYIVSYLGSLGTWYLLDEMMKFFALLLLRRPDAFFLFLTKDNETSVRKAAEAHHIPQRRILVKSPSRKQIPEMVALADCSISFIRPVSSKTASSPVKWAENLACGIPVVVNKGIGDIESLKDKAHGLIVTEDFTTESYQLVINQLLKTGHLTGGYFREESKPAFDLEKGIQSYHELYLKAGVKKILFVASHRPGRAPNQRFRFEQYFPAFEKNGFSCQLSHLIDKSDDQYIYKKGHLLKKAWFFFGKSLLRRFQTLTALKQYHLIFVAREALMTHSIFFEKRYHKNKAGFIYDFDDSVWLTNVSDANRLFRWLKNPAKTPKIIAAASHVIAGNEYLAGYAARFTDKISIIPTTIDTEVFCPQPSLKQTTDIVVIGWTGSITTIPHFEFIIPVLMKIKEKYKGKVKFEVVGDKDFYHAGLGIIGKAWSLEAEREILSSFDIGIMPLPDDEWTRGKCGFKGLLCMSVGVPVIMSPVGVNKEIIEDGVNGFLAANEEEWFRKLCMLVDSHDLRLSMARKGRLTVEEKFSVKVWKDVYIDLFKRLTTHDASR